MPAQSFNNKIYSIYCDPLKHGTAIEKLLSTIIYNFHKYQVAGKNIHKPSMTKNSRFIFTKISL